MRSNPHIVQVMTIRYPSYRKTAKRLFGQFPRSNETKEQRVARKQRESIPLERAESKLLNLPPLSKSADRMLYDKPINRQALKDISFKKPKLT
jgi:hypothetical protein